MKTFEAFSAEQHAAGCDEVLERQWKPDTVIATHSHAWLTVGGRTQHLKRGEGFELEPGAPHDERCGPERGTVVVRHAHHDPGCLHRAVVPDGDYGAIAT